MLKPDDHVLDLVDAYVHDVLPPHERRAVQLHSERCPICQVALEQANRRLAALKSLPAPPVSQKLLDDLARRLADRRRPRFQPRQIAVAGALAAALLIGCFQIYFSRLEISSYDLRVLGQSEVLAGSNASLRVMLLNHTTGQPIGKIPVSIDLADAQGRKNITLCKAVTDRNGTITPRLKWPDWADGTYQLRVTARTGFSPETITRGIKLHRAWQLMLSSDKPVYQPGQTIKLRGLALRRPDSLPAAGQEAVFTISDPKGNKIFRQRQVTSRFGIVATDCPLADEIIEGAYQIECQVEDTSSSLPVDVHKYVLPKFKLDVTCDRTYYQPGQKIQGTVQADYFFGQPVSGGSIDIELRAKDIPPNQPPLTRRASEGNPPLTRRASEGTPTELGKAHAQTDAAGKATFELTLPGSLVGRPQDGGDATIELAVTIHDAAGQQQSTTLSRLVAANPIHIEVLPESGTLVPGVTNRIYLLTSYPDGQPAKTRLSIAGVDHELTTNELGAASLDVDPARLQASFLVTATDDAGLAGRREVKLPVGSQVDDFLVRSDKAVYTGGETMHLLALGGGPEPVFLDLVRAGQTVGTESIAMADGQGEFQFDLPADLSGPLQLCVYRYGRDGLVHRKTRLIFVEPAQSVAIATQLDRQEYRPGERAKLSFTLTDSAGRPAPGALSLAAVDEAVFRVGGPLPVLQATYAALDEQLLQPVHAIYPWTPDMRPRKPGGQISPVDCDQFEQALFSAAAKTDVSVEEQLRPFLGGITLPFEALNRPDWEELAEQIHMPPETTQMLRKHNGSHSLTADSFAVKRRTFLQRKEMGESVLPIAWACWFVVAIPMLVWLMTKSRAEAAVVFVVIFVLAALIAPTLQRARESSRLGFAMNDLKQISLADEARRGLNHEAATRHFAVESMFRYDTNEDEVAQDLPCLPFHALDEKAPAPPRMRQWFPETLLWRPELITDDAGHATLVVDLADSITAWRLSATAITAAGKLGAAQDAIRVFQPFFVDFDLPVSLTRGDELAVPVVVYNYLDQPQTVALKLAEQSAFTLTGDATQRLELAPREVRSVHFRLRATQVGQQTLEVQATAGATADAIRRTLEIMPDGQRVEQVASGSLDQPATVNVTIPETAIPGSARTLVKIYPSTFSQVVEGLDAIFQRPSGCFEQTSSTTYPNVLALEYLHRTKQKVPAIEAKADAYIHLGCQRLLSFEIAGGGFDWFGRPPANRILSAYGLLEFVDMARVHDVDPAVIERTRSWLLSQQQPDGSWLPEGHGLESDPTRRAGSLGPLSATAYVAWSVFADGQPSEQSRKTLNYLLSYLPGSLSDPYLLAQVALAIHAIDPKQSSANAYLDRLDSLKRVSADGQQVWWELSSDASTPFYGRGPSGNVETTALSALALIEAGRHPESSRLALEWLIRQKDARGIWPSTQATVLALKALLAGTGKSLAAPAERQIEIGIDDVTVERLTIPAENFDVVREIDLTSRLGTGSHRITVSGPGNAPASYQVLARHYLPQAATDSPKPSLAIDLVYDRRELPVGDSVGVIATITNHLPTVAPMVLVDLPIPAGFAIDATTLDAQRAAGTIAKYQLTPRQAIIYLRALPPATPLVLTYRLRATMPVKVTAQPPVAYEYYNPDVRATGQPAALTAGTP